MSATFAPVFLCLWWRQFTRVSALETVVNLMARYLHFTRQPQFVSRVMAEHIKGLQAGVAGEDGDKEARA